MAAWFGSVERDLSGAGCRRSCRHRTSTPPNRRASLPSPALPIATPARLFQVFSRIRQHAERTKRDHYSWADLLDFLGTSFKVGGGRRAEGN